MDDVDGASRAAQPGALELGTVVGAADTVVRPRSGIVDDRLAGLVEATEDHEMAVRAAGEEKAVELARAARDRRDQRDAGADQTLGLGERSQLGVTKAVKSYRAA